MRIFISMIFLLSVANSAITCKEFKSWKEAQAYYDAKKPGYKNLDKNHDGEVCQHLSHKNKNVVKHIIRTYRDGVASGFGAPFDSKEECTEGIIKIKSIVKDTHITYKCVKQSSI